jgi:hypothetical protein
VIERRETHWGIPIPHRLRHHPLPADQRERMGGPGWGGFGHPFIVAAMPSACEDDGAAGFPFPSHAARSINSAPGITRGLFRPRRKSTGSTSDDAQDRVHVRPCVGLANAQSLPRELTCSRCGACRHVEAKDGQRIVNKVAFQMPISFPRPPSSREPALARSHSWTNTSPIGAPY